MHVGPRWLLHSTEYRSHFAYDMRKKCVCGTLAIAGFAEDADLFLFGRCEEAKHSHATFSHRGFQGDASTEEQLLF